MKKKLFLILTLVVILMFAISSVALAASDKAVNSVISGGVYYSTGHYLEGEEIEPGYDIFGYNYQAHMFKGSYYNSYAGAAGFAPYEGDDEAYLAANPGAANHWAWPYRDVVLEMKWNDAWLSNKDMDGDGALDRHYGFDSYIGSGAWETNHQRVNGEWTYFTKIVAVPADAVQDGGYWYTADGEEIGEVLWGEFATIQSVQSTYGCYYVSPASCGLGCW